MVKPHDILQRRPPFGGIDVAVPGLDTSIHLVSHSREEKELMKRVPVVTIGLQMLLCFLGEWPQHFFQGKATGFKIGDFFW
jgi:hypothetical protein